MFLDSLRLSFCFGAEDDTVYDTFCSRKSRFLTGIQIQVRDFWETGDDSVFESKNGELLDSIGALLSTYFS